MLEVRIPELARELNSIDISELYDLLANSTEANLVKLRTLASVTANIVYRIHSKGINLRHMGR